MLVILNLRTYFYIFNNNNLVNNVRYDVIVFCYVEPAILSIDYMVKSILFLL